LLLLLAPLTALATPHSAPPTKTVVRFDSDTIDGELMRPEGDLVLARPKLTMPSLVQPPRSFDREARRTILAAAAGLPEAARTGGAKAEDSTAAGGNDVRRGTGSARGAR